MTIDLDVRAILEILGLAGAVILALYKRGRADAETVTRAACDQRHKDCQANCAGHDQRLEAGYADLRDETRSELGRRASQPQVDELAAQSVEHGRLIERLDARFDALADGQARIERVCEHISERLDAREG